MGKETTWAIFVCIAVYALTGLFGSLQCHDETNPNILNNFLKDQSKNGGIGPKYDTAIIVCCYGADNRDGLSVSSLPVQVYGGRNVIS